MKNFKDIRDKAHRQMAFSLFTMAILPATQVSDEAPRPQTWSVDAAIFTGIFMNLQKGYQVSDNDETPGTPC